MLTITVPFKTPLGHEELRTRAHKLGQRHRTLLFLIDGRRPLAEVLSLAHQAGAATSHFEDLLRMGLVELPPDPTPHPPPSFDIPTLTDEASLTSVDMVVLQEVVQRPEPAELPAAGPEVAAPEPQADTRPEMRAGQPIEERIERRRLDVPIDPSQERRTHWRTSSSVPLDPPQPSRPVPPSQRTLPVLSVELEPETLPPLPALARSTEDLPGTGAQRGAKSAKVRFKAGSIPVLNDTPDDPFERTARQRQAYVPAVDPEPPFERTARQFGPPPTDSPPDHATIPAVTRPVAPPVVRIESFKPRSVAPSRRVILDDGPDVAPRRLESAEPAAEAPGISEIDLALPLPDLEEARFLQEVRDLLTDALRLDAPLFSARTFMRVRGAQSASQLIQLVWEIEDHLSHRRRSRRELLSLQKARELLGLGNTVVAGDDSHMDDEIDH